jgi:hypothetical protein
MSELWLEGAAAPMKRCTCVPVTAAGVMVQDPHCPAHGTPKVTFTVKLRDASESVGWLNSQSPLSVSPKPPE